MRTRIANPVSLAALGNAFAAFIPSGGTFNPLTHTDWEQVGQPAPETLQVAQVPLLERLVAEEKDPEEQKALEGLFGNVQKEETEPRKREGPGVHRAALLGEHP